MTVTHGSLLYSSTKRISVSLMAANFLVNTAQELLYSVLYFYYEQIMKIKCIYLCKICTANVIIKQYQLFSSSIQCERVIPGDSPILSHVIIKDSYLIRNTNHLFIEELVEAQGMSISPPCDLRSSLNWSDERQESSSSARGVQRLLPRVSTRLVTPLHIASQVPITRLPSSCRPSLRHLL